MKSLLVLLIIISFLTLSKHEEYTGFKKKQMFVSKILNHVTQPTLYDDIADMANKFNIEDSINNFHNTEQIKEFVKMWNLGMLSTMETFNFFNENIIEESTKTFHLLYNAKTFDHFMNVSSWLREHINYGVFIYAFTLALRHRDDCVGIYLPAISELYPDFFVSSDVIKLAHDIKISDSTDNIGGKYTAYKNRTVLELREITNFDLSSIEETNLEYFYNDISLNTFYYNFIIDYPFWMGDNIFGLYNDRRGELYYYTHKQLLARLNLERLSNNMCDVAEFSLDNELEPSNNFHLNHHTGWSIPPRQSNMKIDKTAVTNEINYIFNRIYNFIMDGYLIKLDGSKVDIKKPEGIELLGRKVYGTLDISDREYKNYLEYLFRDLLSMDTFKINGYRMPSSLLDNYATTVRDPVFWKIQKKLIGLIDKFIRIAKPYRKDELFFAGVNINKISVDTLTTYFEDYYLDISNSIISINNEIKNNEEQLNVKVIKKRLNHKPFNININVSSEKFQDVIVRIFLTPSLDCNQFRITDDIKRINAIEMDCFKFELKKGNNTIIRSSNEMQRTNEARISEVLKILDDNIMNVKKLKNDVAYPNNLLIPKGNRDGLLVKINVIISPIRRSRNSNLSSDDAIVKSLCRFSICCDNMPLGFPFDRRIDRSSWSVANIKVLETLIYHKNYDESDCLKVLKNDNLYK